MSLLRSFARPAAFKRAFSVRQTAVTAPQHWGRWQNMARRATYSSEAGLSKEEVEARVLDVFKGFEKVDPSKLTPAARFKEDLALDSLDAVEVVMAVEEEFSIEIPDAEADEITTVKQAVDYILQSPEGMSGRARGI